MSKVLDWCERHSVTTCILILLSASAILLVSYFAGPPLYLDVPAAAKPVKTPAPTVSCITNNTDDYEYAATECKVTLKDGRTVTCVNISKGTSCDWAHATTKKGK